MNEDASIEDVSDALLSGETEPEDVAVEPFLNGVVEGDETARRAAAVGLQRIAEEEPSRCVAAVDRITPALSDDVVETRYSVAATVAHVAAHDPNAVAAHTDTVAARLTADPRESVRVELLSALFSVARSEQALVAAVADDIGSVTAESDSGEVRYLGLTLLAIATEVDAPAVASAADAVPKLLRTELDIFDNSGEPLVGGSPDIEIDLEEQRQTEHQRSIETIHAGLIVLASTASVDPEAAVAAVRDDTDLFRRLLELPGEEIRGATANVLSYVAEVDAVLVEPLTPLLADLLSDEDEAVRLNAVYALQSLDTERATRMLGDALSSETHPVVADALESAVEG